jgi:hypothetical protein
MLSFRCNYLFTCLCVLEPKPSDLSASESDSTVGTIIQSQTAANDALCNNLNTISTSTKAAITSSGSTVQGLTFNKPNQPATNCEMPHQVLGITETSSRKREKILYFQVAWLKRFPWLHYCPTRQAVLCFYCMTAFDKNVMTLVTKREDAFCSAGFRSWKRAIERFEIHQQSEAHCHAVSQLQQMKGKSVDAQISEQKATEQAAARVALLSLFSSIQFLARQGIALRGHSNHTGNYWQLLTLRRRDIPELNSFLMRTTNFTASDNQNEMLQLISHDILRAIIKKVKDESKQFAIIVDGTQDISGKEQESICLRHIDSDLNVLESFIGLYKLSDTTGATVARAVQDVLRRFDLPIAHLRGQTYDGAANMAGPYNGCQALISKEQPLAIFVHCGAHSANLVLQHTLVNTQQLRDAIQWVAELGTLYNRSMKYKRIFHDVASTDSDFVQTIKPLCLTRWLCRTPAIRCVVMQYKAVLKSLKTSGKSLHPDTAAKANGLLDRFEDGTTLLLLQIALTVCDPLENLNKLLQSQSATLNGMLQAAQTTLREFKRLRSVSEFERLFQETSKKAEQLNIEIRLPRYRKPPARFTGRASAYQAATAEEHYRAIYFMILDNAAEQLRQRFDSAAPGLSRYLQLEQMLLSGTVDSTIVEHYPELENVSLALQLAMFHNQFTYTTVEQARVTLRGMGQEVRALFTGVEQLIRLLLLCPASSCTAERSFSALRRLKTWLRNNMTQSRLNAVAVCNVHREFVDCVDLCRLAEEFAGRSEIRRKTFGNWE